MYTKFLNRIILPFASFISRGNYYKFLTEWENYDRLSTEQLKKLQEKRVKELLDYSSQNIPYYKSLNLTDNDLKSFPILTKEILRNNVNDLIAKNYKVKKLAKYNSSGSSGFQSFTYMSLEHKSYIRALQTHWWKWGGFKPGKKTLQTGISPVRGITKAIKDFLFRINYLESFKLNDKIIGKNIKTFIGKNETHLAGYPSALQQIADYVLKNNIDVDFDSVITFGDKLFEHYRENFKRAFKNPVIVNTYGCNEGMLMACQIDLPYYYIMSPHVYIEVVDDDGNEVENGKMGNILVTCLTNYAMPIIRYKLGDLGVMLPKAKYPKNSRFQYPLLEKVIGRETDVIKTPNKTILTVHSFTGIIEYLEYIKSYKVIQLCKNKLIIEYTTEKNESLNDNQIQEFENKLNDLVEFSMDINFEKVKSINPSPSGKPQIIEIISKN